jgi:hypothetical protein
MLFWHGSPYVIDHGAALTFHHNWPAAAGAATKSYDASQHALLGSAPDVAAADAALGPLVTDALVGAAIAQVPDEWLDGEAGFASVDEVRRAYAEHLQARLAARSAWLPALREAAAAGPSTAPVNSNRPRRPR